MNGDAFHMEGGRKNQLREGGRGRERGGGTREGGGREEERQGERLEIIV